MAGKEPSWVTMHAVDYNDIHLDHDAEDGTIDILYDQQVFPPQQSFYCHKIMRILTETGIQNTSQIAVNFDPSYQQLIFHKINIRRGQQVIDELQLGKIKTIQQEKELDQYMYNGSLSSIRFLEDVRKGDVIEYSYTVKGFNPIFKGKYSDSYRLCYGVPVYNLYYKLITSTERNTITKNFNSDIKPSVESLSDKTIYEWKLNNLKAFHAQDGLPSWYDPYPYVQISEYADWKAVNDWALELFPAAKKLSPALQKKITEIKTDCNNTDDRILAALRFVQDDIRYMGIEMGINSHKPCDPSKTFGQRFGDCKDKTYLLCTILQELGIEASPVLLNTVSKKSISDFLPSANIFDHATVRVRSGGLYYWFDPTISFQRGTISHISYPDYQCGLVVGENTTGLTFIDFKETGSINVKEIFDIEDMSGKATLKVITTYTGSFADGIRSDFSGTSNYEMLKTFKNYYMPYYEHIVADSLHYTDNEVTGALTTMEYYRINELWEIKDNMKKAVFESYVINGIIRKPKEVSRSMPFALNYPAHFRETVEINVPDEWTADESSNKIESPSFSMTTHFSYRNKKFLLLYEYENLRNAVAPGEIGAFMNAIKKIEDETAFHLTKPIDKNKRATNAISDTPNSRIAGNVIAILLFLVFIGGMVWRLRKF